MKLKRLRAWFENITYSIENKLLEIKHIKEKIIGTWDYLCFMWTHNTYREWDYGYLYDLIAFKLNRISLSLRDYGNAVDHEVRYEEIQKALAYYSFFKNIEYGDYDHDGSIEAIKDLYKQQQEAWDLFHDTLKEHGQGWWD